MKLLTLNTHSLHGECSVESCHILCSKIVEEQPDIIALQEVNQHMKEYCVSEDWGYLTVGEIPIKESNFALSVQKMLTSMKQDYRFSWLGVKNGYRKFEEGLAIFSKAPIKNAKSLLLSNTADFNNFKKRMALLTETDSGIFINCHLGWENDPDEPYENQLRRLNTCYSLKKQMYLLGDFNVPEGSRGYEKIISSGWHDTFLLAEKTNGRATIFGKIDGWEKNSEGLRIDYIFANKKTVVKKSEILFDGKDTPVISDHVGVMITL